MIKIRVNTRHAYLLNREIITTGSVGISISFDFSSDWNGLEKVAVFKNNLKAVDVVMSSNECNIPQDILTVADVDAYVGIYGTDGSGKVVIPTIWVNLGKVHSGAIPSGAAAIEETPSIVDQVIMAASSAKRSAEEALASEINAKTSEENSKTSEDNAKASEENSKISENNAKTSEENASDSETNAKKYRDFVEVSAETVADNLAESNQAIAQTRINAENAKKYSEDAENYANKLSDAIERYDNAIIELQMQIDNKIDDGYADADGYLILTANGVERTPIGPFAGGGGGGGGGASSIVHIDNKSGWSSKTIAYNSDLSVDYEWYSIRDDIPTGDGTLEIYVNNARKVSKNVSQGAGTVEIGEYLSAGANLVKIQVTDIYSRSDYIQLRVSAIDSYLTSPFDPLVVQTESFVLPLVPVGAVEKNIIVTVDGATVFTTTTEASNRQISATIPALSHGSHVIEAYFTADINGETIKSNTLFYDITYVVKGNDNVIISSSYNTMAVSQYTTVILPHTVYDPNSPNCETSYYANDKLITTLTVDRSLQTWSYRADDNGELVLQIVAGTTVKEFVISVTESEIDVKAETEQLSLYLSSYGRSNNEDNPDVWDYEDIKCNFTGFNHVSDGWQKDDDGISVCRVAGKAKIEILDKIFSKDFRGTGKTIEIEFATHNVLDYDTKIISCVSDNVGFYVTPQLAHFESEQSEMQTQFGEDEHIRVSFVVGKRSEYRLMSIYIDGEQMSCIQYPDDDDFSQPSPVNITIGSEYAMTDIYCIRVYDNDLTRYQILDNYIADTQNVDTMLSLYSDNNVFDAYGNIVIDKLPKYLPYLVIVCPQLPQYKGDKKTCSGYYVDPVDQRKSFTFDGATIDVQGTSSQYYVVKNIKAKFASGFVTSSGNQNKYQLRDDSIPASTFTFKADVASSEGANNVELVRLYNDACPYKTPAQMNDSRVRQGIDGFPIVIFHQIPSSSTVEFIGKYNFNNDKSTAEVYGFGEGDESWEILNNTSNRVTFRSNDFSGNDWRQDFESRYPEDYYDVSQLKEFADWITQTDPDTATNDALPEPIIYGNGDDAVEYTTDSKEYRLSKFKAEVGKYCELDSAMFYYLFTEMFTMVDSRAKNAFPSFIGAEFSGEE